jgi:hypothetical protein
LLHARESEFVQHHHSKVADDKFKCTICPKKVFCAHSFVEKHLLTKHPERLTPLRDIALLDQSYNNFRNDPYRVQVRSCNTTTARAFSRVWCMCGVRIPFAHTA